MSVCSHLHRKEGNAGTDIEIDNASCGNNNRMNKHISRSATIDIRDNGEGMRQIHPETLHPGRSVSEGGRCHWKYLIDEGG